VSSGQPSVANGHSAEENQVSSTSSLRVSSFEPHSTQAIGFRLLDRQVAVGALPDRQLVTPPQLARDTPVGRLLERLDREAVLRLGMEENALFAQRRERRLL
jgi:hypothetical protein